MREAELNLEFTKIISPIDGRVSRTRIREGNLVQPGTNDSAVLTTVVTTSPIYVYFNVDEQALLKYQELALRRGAGTHPERLKDLKMPVEIGMAHEEGFPHAGIIDFADNKMDRTTGTLRVRGIFKNENEYLTPGLVRPRADSLRRAARGPAGRRARHPARPGGEVPAGGDPKVKEEEGEKTSSSTGRSRWAHCGTACG